jgi:DHA2 family multidrug resistance protein
MMGSAPAPRQLEQGRAGTQASDGLSGQASRSVPDNYKWLVLITAVFGAFASILDATIVNTALPTIQRDFNADLHLASYVATAYILAAGVVVPASAYLASRFGIKRIYLLSLSTFTIFSAVCGIAPNMGVLIGARVLQGAGGAALFPLSFAMLFAVFPESERGKANGIFGIPVLVAPALGPTLGGFISEYIDWRWVFYVNVPVGIIGVLMGLRFLREGPMRPDLRFDVWGFVLAASGLGLLLFGLSNLAYDGWDSVATVSGPIIISVVLLSAFVPVELRREQPLLNLRLYQRRNYSLGTVIILVATVGLFGPAFLLPQYLQILRGLSPFHAGLLLLAQGVGAVIGTIVSGQIYNRVGPKALIITGSIILTVTGFALANWTTATADLAVLPWILFPRGIGLPLALQSTNVVALQGIRGPNLPQATTLNVVARNVMGALSIGALTSYLQHQTTVHLAALGPRVASHMATSQGSRTLAGLPKPILDAFAAAYHDTYVVTAVITIPTIIVALLIQPGKPGGDQPRAAEAPAAGERERQPVATGE